MTAATGVISGVSVSHRRAGVETIEAVGIRDERAAVAALLDHDAVREAFAIETCHRVEAYVVTDDPESGRAVVDSVVEDLPEETVVELGHEESLRHLMRVACGLESVVLGEDQIIGQVRDAYANARAAGGIGPLFETGIEKALHVGERARTETGIDEGVVSLGSAAVELAADEADLGDATALVVGTGEMGTLAATALAEPVDELFVANRSLASAEHVAGSVDADATPIALDDLPEAVAEADVVVSATASPEPVFEERTFEEAGETFVIDLAQPRDVPPAAVDRSAVTVRDLDALESVTDETHARRREAAAQVEAMIDEEFDRLLARYKRQRADEAIGAMYAGAERMKERELARAVSKLEADGLTDDQRAIVESFADALVNQLLAAPTRSLRDAAEADDWSTINTALGLFDPSFDGDAPTPRDASTDEEAATAMAHSLVSAVDDQLDD
ncbi:glutamyl-tRNA reductase [Halococcus agarilyticus]|uniref:glutamyl-tRNA reductase n=1 Tax=Halococcus agarilyticus TaxID=1232219 RepID=UPI000677ADF7|nr:glutamyl-tRNA reductase [Halococcus agarilyticus]